MWEIFTCGSVPYAGIHVMKLASELRAGERLEKPENVACLDDMLVRCSNPFNFHMIYVSKCTDMR